MNRLSTLRIVLLSVFFVSFSSLQAQVVSIPDSNFKAALVANTAVNTNGDSEIQTAEASAFTGTLRVSNKNISDLTGIEAFINVTVLWCDNNNLTSINLESNTKLIKLYCNHNQLTSLDVSQNIKLTELRCYVNRIEALDVHNNIDLTVLQCFQNRLTELNLGLNEDLIQLQCSFNAITDLDVSGNHALTSFDARKNHLSSLNVKNGNNENITVFNTTNNPDLFCIQVDNPEYSQANWWSTTDRRTFFSTDCAGSTGQIVNIPDANFKSALVNNPQINRNNDNEIQVGEASVYDGAIKVSARNISDLTGIEAFAALRSLDCSYNTLSTLDLTHNTALNTLRCDHAGLTSLQLGYSPNMVDLRCYYNELTSLVLDGAIGLKTFWVFGNKLSAIDLSSSSQLVDLRANHNQLTSLVLGNHPQLQTVYAYSNKLTALNVSGSPMLADLRFNLNKVTGIDLSANTRLTYLNAGDNPIASLNLSTNTLLRNLLVYNSGLPSLDLRRNSQLTEINVSNNQFPALNVKNGNNQAITYFNSTRTPALSCIEVDDPAWSEAHWPLVDPANEFKTDCGQWESEAVVNIPDANFKAALVGISAINRNGDGEIQVSEASEYTGQIQVASRNIVDMTGIEAFTAATLLNCADNQIRSLYLDKNVELVQVHAFHNQINVMWFGSLPKLRAVSLDDNQIQSIELRELPELWSLEINNNVLTSLNVSSNPKLDYLGCGLNKITSLDVSTNTVLRGLGCHQNPFLTNLNVKNGNNTNIIGFYAIQNPALYCIQVDDPAWAEANWRDTVDPQATFSTDCGGSDVVYIPDPLFKQRVLEDNAINTNGDGEIQVSEASTFTGHLNLDACGMSDATGLEAFTAIFSLNVEHNNLTTLDLSANVALRYGDCGQNKLTHLKVNQGLEAFACYYNLITSLDLNGNNTLWYFDATDNKLTSADVSSLGSSIKTLSFAQNPITSINVSAMPNLENLAVYETKLESIDVSANANLRRLDASNNPELVTINAKNGNNTDIVEFRAFNSPNLRCVQVDDVDYAEANFDVDPTAYFSLDCSSDGNIVYIPDPNLKAALLSFHDVNTNHDTEIQVIEAMSYDDYLPLANKGIRDPTGLEAFEAARVLDISRNNLTSLDVRPMTALDYLDCSFNQLTSLHWVNTLSSLSCSNNQLTSLDLASTPWVSNVYASFNPLGSLDLSQSTDLRQLGCTNCGLSSLDVSQNPLLEWLFVDENQLTALDVSANPVLASLNVDDNLLTELDLSENPNLYLLWCSRNQLTELDLDGMIHLEEFGCSSNRITTLNVGNAPAILTFLADGNLITELDFTGAQAIAALRIQNNRLTSLNMKGQGAQEYYTVDGRNNPDLHCIEVSDVAFAEENWANDFDSDVSFSTDCGSGGAGARISVSVYPNPTTDKLTIESTEPVDRVHIFDATGGRLMGTQTGNSVDMSSYQKGIYLISVQHGGNVTPVRIVKE